jgi:hypothetical protein
MKTTLPALSPESIEYGFALEKHGDKYVLFIRHTSVASVDSIGRMYELEAYINAYIHGYRSCAHQNGLRDFKVYPGGIIDTLLTY